MAARGLPSKPVGGVFLLHGEDEFRKERAFHALTDLHLDASVRDFNLDVVRGSEVAVEQLASVLATPPMMADWRVVVVRDAEGLAGSSKLRAVIEDVLERPPDGLLLLLVASIASSKARFWTTVKRKATPVEFAALSPDDVPGWVMDWGKAQYGIQVQEDAARTMASSIGSNLGVLDQELAKLRDRVGERGTATVADAEAAGIQISKQDRWQWFALVGERKFAEARQALPILADQGESGVGLAIGLGSHLLRLGVAVAGGTAALERALPRHQKWLAKRVASQARRWTEPEIRDALLGLARLDRLLKSASISDEHLLEEWFLSLEVAGRRVA